jgi:predicted RNA binding protein YcfA (HicA-like mRNA interferase family)
VTYRQLTRKLTSLGFQLYRQAAGSHTIWWHPETGRRTTIPNHGAKDIPRAPWPKYCATSTFVWMMSHSHCSVRDASVPDAEASRYT